MKKIESEKLIERKLNETVRKAGGTTIKLTSQYGSGDPDRLVLMPEGVTAFAELKTTGRKPTKIQELRHKQLRALGFRVEVIDSSEGIKKFVGDLFNRANFDL